MKEKTQTKGSAISGLFTMLLFLVFVLCALFSVLMGSRVYENIIKRSDANFSGTTAISYIANKIRQGDRENSVDIIEVDGTSVLQLKQQVVKKNTTHGSTGKTAASGNCLQMRTAVWVWMTALRYWNAPVFLWKKRKIPSHCRH